MAKIIKKAILAAAVAMAGNAAYSQSDTVVIDRIVAVVGNKPILESAIESQYQQARARTAKVDRCKIYEEMLYQKLLVAQSEIDSLEVSEKEVDAEIQTRLQQFVDQMGGLEKVEEFFNKPLGEIKEDLRDVTEDQLLAQRERGQITKDIKVTPSEVNNFYKGLSKDSLPLIDLQVEMLQIVIYPQISDKDIEEVKKRLLSIKEDVEKNGSLFETKAILYSEDPGSANSGGELGMMQRKDLVPEFSAAAFQLKKDSISDVIKTEYGYHIIQMIDRKGERINVRHILMKPKYTPEAKQKARALADSIYRILEDKRLTFEDAAKLFSQDDKTCKNGGLVTNPYTGGSKFEVEQIYPTNWYNLKNLKVGEFTRPFETYDDKGAMVIKIMMLKSKEEPHIASIETDYQTIQDMALDKKYKEAYDKWVEEKSKSTYIRIAPDYKKCPFEYQGWLHNDIRR
ncbi:MAG: peptidylprolyl isomerase [Bacteroidales bacterium]|nr:peptidylprolyl isomerase [Bacteroidales bacterium]